MQIGFSPNEDRKNKHLNITSIYNRSFIFKLPKEVGFALVNDITGFPLRVELTDEGAIKMEKS